MKPWQGYAHAGVVALSVWFCRETIFEALQWWNGRSPSDGLLLGFCVLSTGLACLPIVALHFSHVMVLLVSYSSSLFIPPSLYMLSSFPICSVHVICTLDSCTSIKHKQCLQLNHKLENMSTIFIAFGSIKYS